jgi:hypothetical protein
MKATDLILLPLRLANQGLSVLWGQGSWSLRDYERRLIDVAAAELSAGNKAILVRQLAESYYVERLHQERMTNIHFRWRDEVAPMDLPAAYRLAKIRLTSGKRAVTVSVEAHRGRIFGLHYNKPPRPLVAGDFDLGAITFGGVPDDRIAQAIDAQEHE